jgi:hypothetical protein
VLYSTNKRTHQRFPSPKYQDFIELYEYWALDHMDFVLAVRERLQLLPPKSVLHISSTFYFEQHRVITKAGRAKRNDTANRIKAVDDALSKIFEFDDCLLWAGNYAKVAIPSGQKEYVHIELTAMPQTVQL